MSTYPNKGNEYNQNFNETNGLSYPNQMSQGYMIPPNANVQQPYSYPPPNYVGVPQPQLQPQPQQQPQPHLQSQLQPQPQSSYYIGPQIPQQNYQIPPQPYMQPSQQMPTPNIYVSAPIYVPSPVSPPQPQNAASLGSDKPKPQQKTNFFSSASMILTSGGMNLAWGAGFGGVGFFETKSKSEHLAVSWFVGVIIGAVFSVYLANKVGKKVIYYASSLLVIIGGILITSCPLNTAVILAARYINGIANGLTIVALLSSGGELSVRQTRGMAVSMEKLSLSLGFVVQCACGFYIDYIGVKDSNQIHGGIIIAYGALALVFNVCFTLESPVYHLLKNNQSEALEAQKKLVANCVNKEQLSNVLLAEHKKLIEDDASRSKSENISKSIIPIIKLSIIRSIVGLTMSLPLNYFYLSAYLLNSGSLNGIFYYGILRSLGNIFGTFLIDKIGRKKLSYLSIIVSGSLFYVCGGLYDGGSLNDIYWCIPFLLIIQFFVGIGIEPTSSAYLSEAFSLSVKPFCIFLVIFFENIVQIITIVVIYSDVIQFAGIFVYSIDYSGFSYALGSFMLCLFIMFVIALPETKGLKLRICNQRFLKLMHR